MNAEQERHDRLQLIQTLTFGIEFLRQGRPLEGEYLAEFDEAVEASISILSSTMSELPLALKAQDTE